MDKNLLIIIPCFNEEKSIGNLLDQLNVLVLPKPWKFSVLVVNDCSKDRTAEVATSKSVKVLNLPINLGIGGAVQSGLKYAFNHGFNFAVQMDGDGQHPPAELVKLLITQQETGANLIIGSRFLEKKGFQSSLIRRLGIYYFHFLNKVFTGINIYDSTSGYRLFDAKAIDLSIRNYPDEYPEP